MYLSPKHITFILNKLKSWALNLMANLVVKDSALLSRNPCQQLTFIRLALVAKM